MNRRDFLARSAAASLAGALPLSITKAAPAPAVVQPIPVIREPVAHLTVRLAVHQEYADFVWGELNGMLGCVNHRPMSWPGIGYFQAGTVQVVGLSRIVGSEGSRGISCSVSVRPRDWNLAHDFRSGRYERVTDTDGDPPYPVRDMGMLQWCWPTIQSASFGSGFALAREAPERLGQFLIGGNLA